jgi:hypothetical protein
MVRVRPEAVESAKSAQEGVLQQVLGIDPVASAEANQEAEDHAVVGVEERGECWRRRHGLDRGHGLQILQGRLPSATACGTSS